MTNGFGGAAGSRAEPVHANAQAAAITVEVEGNLKLGNFSLSFVDLELQLVGLPVTVTRTYDTLEADVEGDFSYGWRLDLSNTQVEVIQPGNTSGVPMPFKDNDRIVFTLPDGSQHGFTFYGKPVNRNVPISEQQAWPEFRPDVGNSSTLSMSQQDPPLLRAADGYVATGSNTLYNPATGAYGEYVLALRNGTQLVIDPREGTLLQLTDALGNTLYFSPSGILHNSGRGVTFERQNDRITAVIDPAGNRIEYAYSAGGDLIDYDHESGPDHVGPDIRDTIFTFDAQGRQLTRTLPLGTVPTEPGIPATDAGRNGFTEYFAYNDLGQQTLHVSFEGIVTAFLYRNSPGSGGQLLEKQFFDSLDDYKAVLAEPAEVWTYAYDAFGRQTHVVVSLRDVLTGLLEPGRTETNTYDILGQLITITSPEGTIHYQYDTLGRHRRTYTGAEDTEGSAALDGIAVTDTVYTYDTLGRLATTSTVERFDQPLASPEVTDYFYDLLGNLDQVRGPSDDVIVDYEYDRLNRLELLRHFQDDGDFIYGAGDTLLAEYDYNLRADGRRSGATERMWYDSDSDPQTLEEHETRIDWFYDSIGRLTREVYDSDDNSLDYATDYLFDLVGNRREKLSDTDLSGTIEIDGQQVPELDAYRDGHELNADETVSYTYDDNDRLLTETRDVADRLDDRLTVYGYDATQQISKTVHRPSGTDDSELTIDDPLVQDTDYGYNMQGRMSQAVVDADGAVPGTAVISRYEYNTAGIRVHKAEGADQILYLVDGNNPTGYAQILAEMNAAKQIQRTYTLGLDVISQAALSGAIYHLLYDGHGSTRALLDGNGNIVKSGGTPQIYAYDAYGNAIGFNPALALTTLLYSGEQFDQRIAMQYLRARYYNPATGTFNRVDPFSGNLHDPQSLHKYLYVHGDPVQGVDPSGWLGVFNQQFGYAVEEQIENLYAKDFAGNDVNFGRWARLTDAFRAKPDVLDHDRLTYMEIKPLSPSGIGAAIAQMSLRHIQFGTHGYRPDTTWRATPTTIYPLSIPTIFFNVAGVLFYTDVTDLAEDFVAVTTLSAARSYLARGVMQRTLGVALGRAAGLAAAGRTFDQARLEMYTGLGVIFSIFI